MTYFNNAIRTKRQLLVSLFQLMKSNTLFERIDRIPIEMRPKTNSPIRCCVHKDRAVIKYKVMALLGYNVTDEEDELTPLSEYAISAIHRKELSGSFLTVVEEACSSCVQVNYTVSNLCKGCEARPCQVNCPKNAISVINGRAIIDHQKCVNCGLCEKACAYHAIIYMPVPCEEACPVKAIKKNEHGVEVIDFNKCIHCGKCMTACPFGAVTEKSHIFHVYQKMQSDKKVVALIAPAVLGQFKASSAQIINALKKVGFDDVVEVARGADQTAIHETAEFLEKMEEGQKFMTTSCCPAYTELATKHIPELMPFVSHTPSPMVFTAREAREKYPDAALVFIGPCLAKRREAYLNRSVDYVMTTEEIAALFEAEGIDVTEQELTSYVYNVTPEARGFAMAGGVTGAVKSRLQPGQSIKNLLVDGINKKSIKLLKSYAIKAPDANFIEVMACEGGCIAGPGAITPINAGKLTLNKAIDEVKVVENVDA